MPYFSLAEEYKKHKKKKKKNAHFFCFSQLGNSYSGG
jgi:hypothetical protein